jgi:D-alanyl-D-alanine carboxypeptidase
VFASPKFAFIILLSLCILIPARSLVGQTRSPNPFLVIDAADGGIIAANREFDQWYPASLTKLMTVYVAMKAISEGEKKVSSPVRISKKSQNTPPSRMGYKVGTLLRMDTAMKILIVKSANDVAVAIAESIAGSVEEFVDRMNQNAKSLGLTATRFVNPNGLHSPNQYTTARDLAILARRILLDFPQYSQWFAIPAIRTTNKTHYSFNLLLERFDGANGMKTGFVCASGYNMVASAKRSNRQLIAVILGQHSQTERAVLAARLLNEAFVNPNRLIGYVLSTGGDTGTKPENLRSVLCTEEARKQRYDPGAGKAVIDSPHLAKRNITRQPTLVKVGGTDLEPGILIGPDAQISIPTKRPPDVPAPTSRTSEGQPTNTLPGTLPGTLPDKIPVPVWRPAS